MDPLEYLGFFKSNHQEIFIEGLSHLSEQIEGITENYHQDSDTRITRSRASQYINIILFKNVFGLCKGNAHTVLSSGTVEIIKEGKPIARGGRGEIFGELGLLTNNVRIASAVTREKTKLFLIALLAG